MSDNKYKQAKAGADLIYAVCIGMDKLRDAGIVCREANDLIVQLLAIEFGRWQKDIGMTERETLMLAMLELAQMEASEQHEDMAAE